MHALIKLRYLLGLIIALTFTAIFSMSYFYDGSSIAKLLSKKGELERVQDSKIEAYSDQTLFGDERESVTEEVDLAESSDAEQGFIVSEKIRNIDNLVILISMIAVWLMLIPAIHNTRIFSFIYLALGLYLICLAVAIGINGGAKFSELSVAASASRWVPCIALWVWLYFSKKKTNAHLKTVIYLLICASSLTFATHGYEAWNEHPKFKDLLYGGMDMFSIPLSESVCILLLKLIGIKDLLLAVAVLFCVYRWRWILLWMTFWGFLTALSRPIAFGDVSWLDALLRVGNGAIPLLIYFVLKQIETSPTTRHETT